MQKMFHFSLTFFHQTWNYYAQGIFHEKQMKKLVKWKKFCFKIVLTIIRKKGSMPDLRFLQFPWLKNGFAETFLNLDQIISQTWPKASKMRLWLQNIFSWFPFFYLRNFGKISNQIHEIFSSDLVSTIIITKCYSFVGIYTFSVSLHLRRLD